ncbi:MAG TPA: cation diffusion facilitator family transporter [Thermoanaerobaculia bacterium]
MRQAEASEPVISGLPSATATSPRKGRLRWALLITLAVLAVEIVGGWISGSLALLADAAHLFTDVAALTLAYAGVALSERAPTRRHTFGLGRAEILAAFVNAQLLLVASGGLLFEAWRRFRQPPAIQTELMLWVAGVGLAANLIAAGLLRGGRRESLGLRAAYLEVVTDALGSVAVIVGAIVMARTQWFGLDALLSAAIALLILPRAVGILREAAHILLEGAPDEVDMPLLRRRLLEVPGVETIHDLHCWTLTSGLHSASVHIRASASTPKTEVLAEVQRVLKDGAGVDHATIQVEQGEDVDCHRTPGHA